MTKHDSDYELDDFSVLGSHGKKRKCTDIIFCIIFSVMLLGFFGVVGYSIAVGDLGKVAMPIDKEGNFCGKPKDYAYNTEQKTTKDLSGFPYLYITPQEITSNIMGAFENRVCVKTCPKKDDAIKCPPGIYDSYCIGKFPNEDTTTFFTRFCMPASSDIAKALFDKFFGFLQATSYLEAIFEVWWALIIGAVLSILQSMILIVLMKWLAPFMIILACVFSVGGLAFLGFYFYKKSNSLWQESLTAATGKESQEDDSWTWFWVAIGVWIVDALILMLVLCSLCLIKTAVKVMDMAGEFLTSHCSVVLIPLITVFLFLVWVVFWLLAQLFMYSIGDVDHKKTYAFSLMLWNPVEKWLVVFLVFAFGWLSAWILSYTYFSISTAVVQWYFEPITGHKTQVFAGLKLGIVYHCGTIAFGSFLILCCWILRAATEWLMNRVRKATNNNACVKCCIACVRCCCTCIENFVKFISRHAYIEVVLRSCSFCEGAGKGMKLVSANALIFSFMNSVMAFVTFTMSIAVGAGSAVIVHFIVNAYEKGQGKNLENLGVDVVNFLIGLVIGRLFFTVYGMSADTILHCYCHDVKKHREAKGARPSCKGFIEHIPKEEKNSEDYNRIM